MGFLCVHRRFGFKSAGTLRGCFENYAEYYEKVMLHAIFEMLLQCLVMFKMSCVLVVNER